MLILCIADVERDVGMKNLSPKEAITILEGMRIDIPLPKAAVTQIKRNLALDMAINALNCSEIPNNSDTISRQAAIDALKTDMASLDHIIKGMSAYDVRLDAYVSQRNQVDCDIDTISNLPPAQPVQRWVPCSERLPEEREWIGTKRFGTTISDEVYVTFEAPDGQRFTDHISFQNGKLSASDAERMRVWYKGAKPVAWMPLPEPWKGEEDEAD